MQIISKKVKIVRLLSIFIGILVLVPFAIGTSPTPPPYHQYSVSGVLERPAGGSRKDFAITVLGWSRVQLDTGFQMLRGVPYPRVADIPVDLTDSAGAFFVRVSCERKLDSLKLAVIVPDRSPTTGAAFFADDVRPIANRESYTVQGEPGCSGCMTETGTEYRIAFYSYYFSNKSITISF